MTNRAEATARPWHVEHDEFCEEGWNYDVCGTWANGDPFVIARTRVGTPSGDEAANAALIVEAVNAWDDAAALRARLAQLDITPRVNSHDTLLALVDALNGMPKYIRPGESTTDFAARLLAWVVNNREQIESLLAEIKKAKP